ncbi:MAG: TetR/AcrR family transcriptional regulator [Spirochaetes bacterium]|jgi:AcrR family transcriptional regulator|nr:TetR/AcrR family transcriptional regulator [Spirochaetota bacterium]
MDVKGRHKRRDGLKRQADIMSHALDLFSSNGFNSTSIDDIIKKAGIARGTFYLHFSSKDDILEMIIDSNLKMLYDIFSQLDISMQKPVNEIVKLYINAAGFLADTPRFKQISVLLLCDAIAQTEKIRGRVDMFFKNIIDMSARYICKAQEEHRVIDNIDPFANSICIVGAIKEIVYRWAVLNEDIDIKKAIFTAVAVFFRGMLVNPEEIPGL